MTDRYPILKGIPMPERRQYHWKRPVPSQKLRDTLLDMEAGDAIDVPMEDFPTAPNVKRLMNMVASIATAEIGRGNYRTQGRESSVRIWRAE